MNEPLKRSHRYLIAGLAVVGVLLLAADVLLYLIWQSG